MCPHELVPKKKLAKLPRLIPKDWTTHQIRWFKVDSTGINDTGLNKYQIMQYAQVSCRDMMNFDTHDCTILGREGVILLDLEIIKMIIKPEEVLVMEIRESEINYVYDELVRIFDENAVTREESWEDIWDADLPEDHGYVAPLEFRVLEVTLEAICSYFIGKTRKLENDIHLALRELTSTKVNFERVKVLRRDISNLKTSVEKVKDEVDRVMKNKDDMAALYLSRKLDPSSSNVKEILMVLQPYCKKLDMALQWLSKLQISVHDKVEFIKSQLENVQIQVNKFDILLNSASSSVSVCIIMFVLWLWYLSLVGY